MNDDDKLLRQDVINELEFDPSIESTNIGVLAEDGVVTLTGHISDFAQKWNAERAAWRVRGVKALAQEIEVRFPADPKVNDDEIAHRALKVIAWNTTIPTDGVKVRVAKGWVTLTGTVRWHFQRAAAESAVRKLSGVTGVSNSISLVPVAEVADVKKQIEGALKRHGQLESDRIRIAIENGGTVTLEGPVDNWDEREAVKRAAWSASGVCTVEDRLHIR